VDARNIRNIVLMRPINSVIEFKQIVGHFLAPRRHAHVGAAVHGAALRKAARLPVRD
jgi:hypothetical protein